MNFGFTRAELKTIKKVFETLATVDDVVIFGSRVMGNFKKGSDVDLALRGEVSESNLAQARSILNEGLALPYFFDIVIYNEVENSALKEHIDNHGRIFYQKNPKKKEGWPSG